jgi:hypothetical protein
MVDQESWETKALVSSIFQGNNGQIVQVLQVCQSPEIVQISRLADWQVGRLADNFSER